MDASAPSIVRGEFVYHDTLFVDVGGALKRHPRASTSELKTLLDGKAPKDQVAHYYEAQLIHYGLQRSKDKNTAKVRLQQALSQKKLIVPPHIVDMEADMKKDYTASIRKARTAAGKVAKGGEGDGEVTKGKKRKQDDAGPETVSAASKRTKIPMKIGDMEVSIDHGATGAAGKGAKAKAVARKAAATSVAAKGKNIAMPTPTTTRKPTITPQSKSAPLKNTSTPSLKKHSTTPVPPPAAPPSVPSTRKKAVKQEPKARKEPKVKKEPSTSQQNPSKAAPKIKPEIKPEPETSHVDAFEPLTITGVYNVSCPELEEQYPEDANNLRLFFCVDNEAGKIWGGFQLASKSGVMLLADGYTCDNGPVSFGWRARDLDQGGLSFGRGCFGEIEFARDGRMQATFYNLFSESQHLQGTRRPGPLWCGKSAWEFEREWDEFVAETYGR
jgi:hypothetical protein